MIVTWQGSIETIPDGWALCDGSEGRPDLRNEFIIGPGGAFTPGMMDPNFLVHRHMFTADGHTHDIPADGNINAFVGKKPSTQSTSPTATTDLEFSRPPYYSLAFIVKL